MPWGPVGSIAYFAVVVAAVFAAALVTVNRRDA
jgi:ABC-2 type transport system permease protein